MTFVLSLNFFNFSLDKVIRNMGCKNGKGIKLGFLRYTTNKAEKNGESIIMPLYEFKCNKCDEFFEILVMNSTDEVEMKCPKCSSETFERVISRTSYSMGSDKSSSGVSSQTRTCSSGNCTTYTLPGHTRN